MTKKKDNVQTIYTIDATIKIVILTQHVKNEKLWTSMLQSVYKLQNNAVKNALLFLVFKKYLLQCMYICLGFGQVLFKSTLWSRKFWFLK